MMDLHEICLVGIVDPRQHTIVVEGDVITISRGYGVNMQALLPPPQTDWFFMYDADGKRVLDASNNVIRLPRS